MKGVTSKLHTGAGEGERMHGGQTIPPGIKLGIYFSEYALPLIEKKNLHT